jgi:peptidoglycan/LPS O-acetylase OafA/YrhL
MGAPGPYRPDIDGLRALSVIAVVLFHGFPALMPGGFIGVDVFFVISGFLITASIRADMEAGEFRLRDFWARRIRRIFPALLTVLAAVLGLGWLYLLPTEFDALKSHTIWGLGFGANFKLNSETGYFDTAAELKPLLHLWSLAIEEQFYLVWPVVVWAAYRRRGRAVTWVTAGCLAASFASRLLWPHTPSQAFYFPWTRVWELLAGALLALGQSQAIPSRPPAPRFRQAAGLIGIGVLFIGFFMVDRDIPLLSAWMLVPVAASALVIVGGMQPSPSHSLLSLRPLVFVGVISYPLYLWHWPLLSLMRIVLASRLVAGMSTWPPTVAVIGFSFVLAAVTYWTVERFMRRERGRWRWRAPALAAASLLFAAFVSRSGVRARAVDMSLDQIDAAIKSSSYPGPAMVEHWLKRGLRAFELKTAVRPMVLFVGDSHARQYAPRIERISADRPAETLSSMWLTEGACLPIAGYQAESVCDSMRTQLLEILASPATYHIDRIVWTEYWAVYLEGGLNRQTDAAGTALTGAAKLEARRDGIRTLLRAMKDTGLPVTVLLDTPHGNEYDPRMIERSMSGAFHLGVGAISRAEAVKRQGSSNDLLRAEARALGFTVLDPLDVLCSPSDCAVRDATGRPLMRDYEHLTTYAAEQLLTFIDRTVMKSVGPGPGGI